MDKSEVSHKDKERLLKLQQTNQEEFLKQVMSETDALYHGASTNSGAEISGKSQGPKEKPITK